MKHIKTFNQINELFGFGLSKKFDKSVELIFDKLKRTFNPEKLNICSNKHCGLVYSYIDESNNINLSVWGLIGSRHELVINHFYLTVNDSEVIGDDLVSKSLIKNIYNFLKKKFNDKRLNDIEKSIGFTDEIGDVDNIDKDKIKSKISKYLD